MNTLISFYSLMLFSYLFLCAVEAKEIIVVNHSGSIQQAIDQARSGDVILIEGGIYFESIVIKKSGLTIKPKPGEEVKITSAYPEYFNKEIKWKKEYSRKHPITGKSYTVYAAAYPKYRKKPKGLIYGYISDSDDQLYFTYRDKISFDYQYAVNKEVRGAFFDSDKIYIASEKDPNKESLYVSDRRIAEIYKAGNITIDGGDEKNLVFANGGRYGIIINLLSGEKSVLKNLRFINSHSGVMINSIQSGEIEISNNLFNQYLEELPWEFQKTGITDKMDMKRQDISKVLKAKNSSAAYMETTAVLASKNGVGRIKILDNSVYGYFNGIVSTTNNVEIAYNKLSELRDDAIEIEGHTPDNVVHHNDVSCSFVGISLVPVRTGPVYIYQNEIIMNNSPQVMRRGIKSRRLIYRNGKTIKFTNFSPKDISSDVHIYHNRFYALDDVLNIGSSEKPEYNPKRSSFYNNVFLSSGRISSSYGRASDGIDYQGNIFNSFSINSKDLDSPEHRSWKNTKTNDANFKKGIIQNNYKKEIPISWPGAKELNSLDY